MPDSQNYRQEKIESPKDERVRDEQVNDENDRPSGSYYYDDATGYDVYQPEDDDIAELKNEN
jgi:hypothetical protein